jgi:RND family efflux transporter MFP subunit
MNDMTPAKAERIVEAERAPAKTSRNGVGRLFGIGVLLLLGAGLAFGTWRYYAQTRETMADAAERENLVPAVRTATVKVGDATMLVSLPGTTSAFATADIFARGSGYVVKRYVDIGDRVKQGQLLAEISAPEIDHQIAQAQATLSQSEAALRQQQANADLASVTWGRDKPLVQQGWVTAQQGSVDQQTLEAQQAAVGVAQSNVAAQQAQIKVLQQAKDYLSVLAPFDGVVTRRNIDVGSLVQADATTGTFMFTVMQTNVIRTQVYVPQDQAFGVAPGVEAVVRVPELPDRGFSGAVTRMADALDPLTRTLLTEIDVPNPDGALPSGVY